MKTDVSLNNAYNLDTSANKVSSYMDIYSTHVVCTHSVAVS